MSSESHKMSQKPLDEMTPEELKKFVDSIDTNAIVTGKQIGRAHV